MSLKPVVGANQPIDPMARLITSQVGQFHDSEDTKIIQTPKAGFPPTYLVYANRVPFDDIKVRQDMIMVIDKNALIRPTA